MEVGGINFSGQNGIGIDVNVKAEKTLQSIDGTLKRIEAILLAQKNQSSVLDGSALSEQQ